MNRPPTHCTRCDRPLSPFDTVGCSPCYAAVYCKRCARLVEGSMRRAEEIRSLGELLDETVLGPEVPLALGRANGQIADARTLPYRRV